MGDGYLKYQFCKSVDCLELKDGICDKSSMFCPYTAKEFHKWLKDNGFKITKEVTAIETI